MVDTYAAKLTGMLTVGVFVAATTGVAGAATRTANSCSYADVASSVAASAAGDTVNVPAGTCAWSSTLSITTPISLVGAGKGKTIITNSVGTLVAIKKTQSTPVRLSGFTFNNSDNQSPIVLIVGPAFKVRIDNMVFNKGDAAVGSNWNGAGATGPVYGVVHSSEFYNTKRTYFAMDVRSGESIWGSTAWAEFSAAPTTFPGSEKMMYFEDNAFVWNSSNTDPAVQGALYGQYGGKAAFRRNTFNGLCTYIDAHGDKPDYSTIYYEIYDNTFVEDQTLCKQGDIVWLRGGQMIAHGNTFTGSSVPFRMSVYWTTDLAAHRVMNTYYWGNTWNGSTVQSSLVVVNDSGQTPAGYSASAIKLGAQFYLQAPQSGQTYFPYTPYTYPHPLRSELPAPVLRII
ncbi:MAG: hypothetical protein U1F41_15930 [Burkholderiales bacterium]